MPGNKGESRKRKKSFYRQSAKRSKNLYLLLPNIQGFIITCNKRERESVTEAYRLLNNAVDNLKGEAARTEVLTVSNVSEIDGESSAVADCTTPVVLTEVKSSSVDGSEETKESLVLPPCAGSTETDCAIPAGVAETKSNSADGSEGINESSSLAACPNTVVIAEAKRGSVDGSEEGSDAPPTDSEDDDDDIASALRREASSGTSKQPRMFQQVRTDVTNCLFIQSTCPTATPTQLVNAIFKDILASSESQSRYVMRLLPVEGTCRADLESMRLCLKELWQRYLATRDPAGKKTFTVQFKMRNYNRLQRDEVLTTIGQVVREGDHEFKTDFICPGVVLSVNVLKTVCCFGILDKYIEYKKYNLQELL